MFLKLLQKIRNSKRVANSPAKEIPDQKSDENEAQNTPTTSTKPTSEAKILPASNTDTKSRWRLPQTQLQKPKSYQQANDTILDHDFRKHNNFRSQKLTSKQRYQGWITSYENITSKAKTITITTTTTTINGTYLRQASIIWLVWSNATADSWEVESASHKHGDKRPRSWRQEACNASAVKQNKWVYDLSNMFVSF